MIMSKILYNRFEKKLIGNLPRVVFEGKIIVIVTPKETKKAVDFLLSQPILGIDTETRPSFKRGKQNVVSLLQVSTIDTCFLFRLNYTGLTTHLIRLLQDTTVPKVGLSLHDDVLSLRKRGDFTPGNFIDLQDHFKELGVEDLGLQKIFANVFGQKISKAQQLSNWDADVLNEKQKQYAATDAWACIMLYNEYMRLRDTGDYELVVVETPKVHNEDDEVATNETACKNNQN